MLLIRLIKAYQFRRDRLLTLELHPLACQRLIMEKHPEAGEAFLIMQKLTSSVCKALVVTIHMQSPPSQPRPLIVHHCPSCHGNDLYSKKSWEKDNLERYIYIYAFSRRFYPKQLTLHSSYSFTFYQLLLSLGIEPMILALLAPCSTI